MIGKADCGKPCYAFNETLLYTCPECHRLAKEKYENGTYQEQVFDNTHGQYKWEERLNEENICLYFNFNEKVDECDVDFDKLCEFFDKEDKEKTVHWSYIDKSGNSIEKDMPIHYMMIDGERFEFPYGLGMREFFYMNDENLFPLKNPDSWKDKGYCFGLFYEGSIQRITIGKSLGFYGVNMFHYVTIFECTSCKLKYHIIRTCPLMFKDKSKDPK